MSEDKYQIDLKSKYIHLSVLLHDLEAYDVDLKKQVTNISDMIFKLRCTKNICICLHNIKDAINSIRIQGDQQFTEMTRSLRRKLEFISHIRNKSSGHIDYALMTKATQWAPQIFYEREKSTDQSYIIFESYRAIIESAINSYLSPDGKQKIFEHEIDLLYPPDQHEFYLFLQSTVESSMSWLTFGLKSIESNLEFISSSKISEMAYIAGITDFNLSNNTTLEYDADDAAVCIKKSLESLRATGIDPKTIDFIESQMTKYNK